MHSASQQAMLCNNAAASQIEVGQYPAAIENLSAVVSSFRGILRQGESHVETNYNDIFTVDDCMVYPSNPTVNNSTDTQFVYEHPIRIPENNAFGTTYCESSMISSLVIFNLALAHHLQANRKKHQEGCCHLNERPYDDLRKARVLYEISMNLHHDAKRSASPDNRTGNAFFTLVIFNNLGLVHRRLQNQEASVKCFQYVLSTLMCFTDAGYVHPISSTFDGFFVNVTPLISTTPAAQAA
jgi:hypothetical protein